ncbi:MAG TPA: SDR family oxidoreductase [Vicinamibacterales bacterium]|jgi:nucleoside-diphosphate-sugar epimerase
MKVLFVGGTGNISSACSRLAIERGMDLTLLTRGRSTLQPPAGTTVVQADVNDRASMERALGDTAFDVVVDWVAFTPADVERDLSLFRDRTAQYVFISSASAYQKPPVHYLITESTPLRNPYWAYSRQKIACEERLGAAYRDEAFPVTIVRPSFTYGDTWIPCAVGGVGYTVVDRMRKGRPIIVHGDGQSLWTMTHNTDFAKGFVGLFGNIQAIGQPFHITSDEVLTWDQIYGAIGAAAGVTPRLVYIPSDFINASAPDIGAGLLGDKACSAVFDNSKIKRLVPEFRATVPFALGIRRSVAWFDADPARRIVNEAMNATIDAIIDRYEACWPG